MSVGEKTPAIQAVIFDLGNVVVEISFAQMVRAFGHDCVDEKSGMQTFAGWKFLDAFERGKITSEEFLEKMNGQLPRNMDLPSMVAGLNDIFIGLMPGVGEIVDSLRGAGIRLGMLSNTNIVHWDYACQNYPLAKWFDVLCPSHELGCRKPEREAFSVTAERLGVPPSACLFFDDLAPNVVGARAAGMRAEQVRSAAEIRSALGRHMGKAR